MTVNFPNGRSTSIPLRLFWRAPRISTQSFPLGVKTRCFSTILEPTGDNSRSQLTSQILGKRLQRCYLPRRLRASNSRDRVSEVGQGRNLCRKQLAEKNHCV